MNNEMSVVLGTVAMEPKGEYNSSTYYEKLNTVLYNGSTYMAKQPSQGITPSNTDYWQFVAGGVKEEDIVDNLNSTATNKPLSANQGKVLDEKIKENCEFIFPKNFQNAMSGDCSLIRYKNKIIMIDTYSSEQYSKVSEMLDDFNITHLDYVIITHYHGDHVGGFKSLVTDGYIDNNTKLYFPAEVALWTDYVNKPSEYEAYCEEHNLIYNVPEEYEELNISDLKLTFFNCDADTLDELYYTNSTIKNYNNCSTVVKLNYKNIQALYTGDCLSEGIQRIYDENFVKGRINLYKVEHHGIEPTANKEFIKQTSPMYAYQPSGILDYQKKILFARTEIGKYLDEVGCKNYIMFKQQDYVKFISNGNSVNCISGVSDSIDNKTNEITYYVDKNATQGTFADGTQEHPFNEINQALCSIKNNPCEIVTINLADGDYAIPEMEFRSRAYAEIGLEPKVILNGNSNDNTAVTINGFYINSSRLEIKNLTLDIDNYEGLYAYNSKVNLQNVNITSLTSTASSHSCIIAREHSEISLSNCNLDYGNEGVIGTNSCFIMEHVNFGSNIVSDAININRTNILYTNDLTYTNYNDKLAENTNVYRVETPQLIYTGSEYSEITLPKSLNNIAWVELTYQDTDDANIMSTGKLYFPNGKKTYLSMQKMASDGSLYIDSARATFSNNKITLDKNRQIIFNYDGTKTIQNEGNYIRITRVIVGFYDYVDYRNQN